MPEAAHGTESEGMKSGDEDKRYGWRREKETDLGLSLGEVGAETEGKKTGIKDEGKRLAFYIGRYLTTVSHHDFIYSTGKQAKGL